MIKCEGCDRKKGEDVGMKTEQKVYRYEGSVILVILFNRIIKDKWIAYTSAPSKKKARSNFKLIFKKEYGYIPKAKIYLPGKVTLFGPIKN